jgi:hypothetical protein
MQTYAEYQPTAFDGRGAFLPNRQNWLVVIGRNRDSDHYTASNFDAALEMLGGESRSVEVHRFGHWACGWLEIILVSPQSKKAAVARDIEERLQGYPLLDEDDASRREEEAYNEAWNEYACREFIRGLAKQFSLWRVETYLDSLDVQTVQDFYQALIPSGEYHHDGCPLVDAAVKECTQAQLVAFIRGQRSERQGIDATMARFLYAKRRGWNMTFAWFTE